MTSANSIDCEPGSATAEAVIKSVQLVRESYVEDPMITAQTLEALDMLIDTYRANDSGGSYEIALENAREADLSVGDLRIAIAAEAGIYDLAQLTRFAALSDPSSGDWETISAAGLSDEEFLAKFGI